MVVITSFLRRIRRMTIDHSGGTERQGKRWPRQRESDEANGWRWNRVATGQLQNLDFGTAAESISADRP
jgi:hypothetical protein